MTPKTLDLLVQRLASASEDLAGLLIDLQTYRDLPDFYQATGDLKYAHRYLAACATSLGVVARRHPEEAERIYTELLKDDTTTTEGEVDL